MSLTTLLSDIISSLPMMTSALRVREHGTKQKKGTWKGLDRGNRKVEVT